MDQNKTAKNKFAGICKVGEKGQIVIPKEESAIVSAVAIRYGEMAYLPISANGITQAEVRVVSRRYFREDGSEVASFEKGITIVATKYGDGSTRIDKIVQK